MASHRIASVLGATVLIATLAACAAEAAPEPSSPPVATSTPTPAPTPTPTLPALTELVVTADGLGPILIGAEPEGYDVSDPLVFTSLCTGFPEGLWMANYPRDNTNNTRTPFAVNVTDGVIKSIEVHSGALVTAEGVHIGTSRGELLAAFPGGFDEVIDDRASDLFVVHGSSSNLMFEVGNAHELQTDPSRVDSVWSIRVWTDAFTPSTIAGSEYTAPWCGLP